jgi:transcriptional regulator with XRE-family HTH domain/Zn-dependent peptidase ImmA (M78 family)
MSVQQRIQQKRKELGLTQTDLAKRAGLNPSAISQYEAGNRTPSYDALIKLSGALKINTEYLLLGETRTSYSTAAPSHKEGLLLNLFNKLTPEQQDDIIGKCFHHLGTNKIFNQIFTKPSEYADYIVNQMKTLMFPINLDEIASIYNIKIHDVDYIAENSEGVLYNGSSKIILLLNSIDNIVRRRFTLAKLLGHAIMPKHVNQEYFRSKSSTLQTDNQEDMEAQIFAEHLLIPEAEFSKDLLEFQQRKDRLASISYLTSKYVVSETMLFNTLVSRRENRFAIIFSTPEGKISRTISKGRILLQNGETLPTLSEAAKIGKKKEKGYSYGTVPAQSWVKDAKAYEVLNEYTSFDSRFGYLTLIEFI